MPAIAAQLPGALDLIVATLEVGRPPAVALSLAAEATVAPLGPELAQLSSRLTVAGDPIAVCVRNDDGHHTSDNATTQHSEEEGNV